MMSGEAGPIDCPSTGEMMSRAMSEGARRCVLSRTTTTAVGSIVTVQLRTMTADEAEGRTWER